MCVVRLLSNTHGKAGHAVPQQQYCEERRGGPKVGGDVRATLHQIALHVTTVAIFVRITVHPDGDAQGSLVVQNLALGEAANTNRIHIGSKHITD